jgi:hypothetical protein
MTKQNKKTLRLARLKEFRLSATDFPVEIAMAAWLLDVSPNCIRCYLQRGRLHGCGRGGRFLVSYQSLCDFVTKPHPKGGPKVKTAAGQARHCGRKASR